jgi:hypothetical protein
MLSRPYTDGLRSQCATAQHLLRTTSLSLIGMDCAGFPSATSLAIEQPLQWVGGVAHRRNGSPFLSQLQAARHTPPSIP